MKKTVLVMLFLLVGVSGFSQKNTYFSVAAGYHNYYYFLEEGYNSKYSYGASLLLSMNIGNIKIASGFSYATLNYNSQHLSYYNYPVLASYNVLSNQNSWELAPLLGFVISNQKNYTVEGWRHSEKVYATIGEQLECSAITGLTLSKLLTNNLAFSITPTASYKVFYDNTDYKHYYGIEIPNNRLCLGLQIGLEYRFK